jgi:hypothetical protein
MTVEIVVIAALLLVPGAGAALAIAAPERISIESRIALAFGLGYGLVAGVAMLLALAHVFSRAVFIAGVVLAMGAVWALALRRASPRAHVSALVAQAREAPFTLAAGIAVLLAVIGTRPLYPSGSSLAVRSAWRYWADGLEVAEAGRVPAETQQWGLEIPTTVSKVVLNAFEGGLSFLLGPEPLPAMHAILVVTAVGLVAVFLALGRELGFGVFAPLVPVIAVLAPEALPIADEIANDLKWYTAEDMGRLGAFSALLVGIHALRSREGRWPAVVTGVLLAIAGLTHLVPTLVAGLMLTLYALALLVADRSALRRLAATGAVAAAVFGVAYVGVLGASGGDLGWQRATSGASFEGFPPRVDPTRSFARGRLTPRREKQGHFLISPRVLLRLYGAEALDRRGWGQTGVLVLAALAVASAALALRARALFPAVVIGWGLAATIPAVALFFSYRYDTVVPGDWGSRRLYGYVGLVLALLVPAILQALAGASNSLLLASRPLVRGRRAAGAMLAAAIGGLAVWAALDRLPRDRSLARAEAGIAVMERVANAVPCGTRMLVNARTAGTWEAMTGRRAVTEGHAPYLRPEVMERVLPVLLGANRFFGEPSANREFLERQRIRYLVAVEPGVWIGTKGQREPQTGDADAIASLPGVRPVFRDRLVSVFAVGSEAAVAAGGQPRRCSL